MTDAPGGGDNNDRPPKPGRPDPFAPLPLADLPPVRRRGPPDPTEPAPARPRRASESPASSATRPPPTPEPRPANPPDTRLTNPPDTRLTNPPDTRLTNPPDTRLTNPPDTRLTNPPDTRLTNPPDTRLTNPPDTRGGVSGIAAPLSGAPPTGMEPAENGAMSWTDMPVVPGSQAGAPGSQAGAPGAQAGAPGSQAGAPGAQAGAPGSQAGAPGSQAGAPGAQAGAPGAQAGAPPTGMQAAEIGAMSWTDMTGVPGTMSAAPSTGMQPSESGALSWTDMSGPQQSGQPMSGAPDTGAADAAADGPLLPSSYNENDLRAAVGATPLPLPVPGATAKRSRRRASTDSDDDDDGAVDGRSKPRNRKMMLVGALTLAVGGAIAAMVIVGKINSQRYLIMCEADRVVVQQGRTFPPWGESSLGGAEWKALKIPPEAPCAPYETDNKAELAARYLNILKDHATTLLTAREVTKIDDAEAQLKQALLVARSLGSDDQRVDARDEIERLLGDVGYWRASAKLRSASEALTEAANEFDVAAKQRPRHVTDAAAWALYVRKLVEQLRAGPAGAAQGTFPPLPPGERPSAPPGVALPVESGTERGSAGSAAEPDVPSGTEAAPPTGGVLL